MIAVLLCAGFAVRMYTLTRDFPKPLLSIADRPVIIISGLRKTAKYNELGSVSDCIDFLLRYDKAKYLKC